MDLGSGNGECDSACVTRTFVLRNRLGLHARPAALMNKTAKRFDAKVTISKDGTAADARSLLGLLTLDAPKGTALTCTAAGAQAEEAIAAFEKLILENFGEE